ncbi:MAG: Helicase associated domain protein [Methylococcales bacterium]|nr:Helicase associated domain protein [Methylococcales bacterium]
MSSFQTLLNSLSPDSNTKGKQFEKITKWFLENDPVWKAQIDKVWLWDDYPARWGRDKGIDLICQFKDGTHWAVQAKCYESKYYLKKKDIDSFLSESNRKEIAGRILVATTDRLGGVKYVINAQEKKVVPVLLRDLEQSKLKYPSILKNLKPVKKKEKPTPREHQTEAINAVIAGLETADKGQMIMCCGTGKTFTSLWIKEALKSQTTLVLLPSLGLLSQTLREWTDACNEDFNFRCVCSDATISAEDDEDMSILDLGTIVTTEPENIEKFLLTSGNKVIFCTYQSSPLIAQVQQNLSIPEFDIVFADEAHRCAGKVSSDFACVLDENKIRARKRLFMTATPRVFSTAVKTAAEGRGVDIACMNDVQKFGKVLHHLTFKKAITAEILTDYKVVIVGVDKPMIKAWIDQRELMTTDSGLETDAQTLAAHIGLMKVMRDYDLKRVISFHSRIKRAAEFVTEHKNLLNWVKAEHKPSGKIEADYVSGKMRVGDRSRKIKQLATLEGVGIIDRMLLANARCLSEGVDVPALDGVAFIDPRKSQVDIVQAVGRAIRNSANKTHGIIVLPVFISDGDNPQAELEKSCYKPIWDVLNALKSHDDVLAEELDNFRTELGRRSDRSVSGFSKIVIDLPCTIIENGFVDAFNARIIEVTTVSWGFWYKLLVDYVEEFGNARVSAKLKYKDFNLGSWVSVQRKTRNNLDLKRIQLLESLTQWSWDVLEDQWNKGFEYLKWYVDEYEHSRVPRGFEYQGYQLGQWVSTQRKEKNTLSFEKIELLESLFQWSWNLLEDRWNEGFSYLKKYTEEYSHARVPRGVKYKDFNLAAWVSNQRNGKNKLSPERIRLFESLPKWSWNLHDDLWNEGFE